MKFLTKEWAKVLQRAPQDVQAIAWLELRSWQARKHTARVCKEDLDDFQESTLEEVLQTEEEMTLRFASGDIRIKAPLEIERELSTDELTEVKVKALEIHRGENRPYAVHLLLSKGQVCDEYFYWTVEGAALSF